MRWTSFFVFILLVLIASHASAQKQESNWKQVCERAVAAPLVTPRFAPASPAIDPRSCDASALYYGFDRPANPAAALQCGYARRSQTGSEVGEAVAGPGVLAMLYANGRGVPRNYDLAIRFACEITWAAQAEMEGRIGHLEQLRDTHAQTTNFDLCDDATSGLMEGVCESIHQGFADEKRRQNTDALALRWPAAVKTAYSVLKAREDAFNSARTGNEVDLSGTGRSAFVLEEQGRLRDQLLINLQRFARGDIPTATAADFRRADDDLNGIYQRLMNTPDSAWYGTIRPAGIRGTQVEWLKLRDAWVVFARAAYPGVSADTVRTQITRLRVHQLQSLLPAK